MLDTLRQQLRQGVAIRSPFDPLSFPAYMIVAVAAIVGAILMAFTGFSFDFRLALSLATWSGALFVAAWLLRSVNHPRLAGAIEAGTLLVCQGFAFLFILYPLAGLSGPYADRVLARADAALGFNWSSFAIVLAQHPLLLRIGLFAYSSFEWQPVLIVAALALCRTRKANVDDGCRELHRTGNHFRHISFFSCRGGFTPFRSDCSFLYRATEVLFDVRQCHPLDQGWRRSPHRY